MLKQFLLYLLLLCNELKLNYGKELEIWKPLSSEQQTLPLRAKVDNAGNSWDADPNVKNIFDGIRFGLSTVANNIRTRAKNVVNRLSTKAPNINSTLQYRHGIFGLRRPPLQRVRMRLRKRTKNTTSTEFGQPLKVVVPYEPIKIVETGLDIIGSVVESIKMTNMTVNNTTQDTMDST